MTTTPPVITPVPQINPRHDQGFTAMLLPHLETVRATVAKYSADGKRANWTLIFQHEPQLQKSLLVGPGQYRQQLRRLNQFYYRYVLGRNYARKASDGAKGAPVIRSHGKITSRLDEHHDEIMELVPQFTNLQGVQWSRLLSAHPALARTVGFDGSRQYLAALGFWFRDRNRRAAGMTRNLPQPAAPAPGPSAPPKPSRPTPAPPKPAIFCSHCGHNITAELLANEVIAGMTRSGLSMEQIIATLTRAAGLVDRLGGQS